MQQNQAINGPVYIQRPLKRIYPWELAERFPEKDERDRIKFVNFDVSGLHPSQKSTVTINWDSIEIKPDLDPKSATDFVDVLDRSTFRYF